MMGRCDSCVRGANSPMFGIRSGSKASGTPTKWGSENRSIALNWSQEVSFLKKMGHCGNRVVGPFILGRTS